MKTEIAFNDEELNLIDDMERMGADDRGVLTQLLCGRSEQAGRNPLLDQLVPIWQQMLPKESLKNLRRFLDAYYHQDVDLARQRVALDSEGVAKMQYTWWIEQATRPAEINGDEVQIFGERLRDCILSRDNDGWLQGLLDCLAALPSDPKPGGSTLSLMLGIETCGSIEYRKADILKKFDAFCVKNRRLPTVGELSYECGLKDKDNAYNYRKGLGLNGIPRTLRGKKR